jgi:cyclic pyranopterin phosphate synthase
VQLTDSFGRRIDYLRLSVTDRCDLRCFYCLPQGFTGFEVPEHWLSFDEIERVVAAFAEMGVQRLRLTGGEPLVRKGLPDLAAQLAAIPGIEDLSLSTNAVQLARHAAALKQAGVSRLNVSLDSISPEKFKHITGGPLDKVLRGLAAARDAGFAPIKLNMVVMKGVNDDEVEAMVQFCIEQGYTLRFIETMPMGSTGRDAADHYLDLRVVRERLERRFDLVDAVMPGGGRDTGPPASRGSGHNSPGSTTVESGRLQLVSSSRIDPAIQGGGPAKYVQVAGTDLKLGFITPISQHFCDTCNRVRLGADGALYLCLGQDHSVELRPHLRQHISHDGLVNLLTDAIAGKPFKHRFDEASGKPLRFMAQTGG